MNLLDFLSFYYNYPFDDVKYRILWICSNIVASNKECSLILINKPLFKMILNTFEITKNKRIISEIFFLMSNILSIKDSEITFSFLNYKLIQNILDLMYNNKDNWDLWMLLYSLNVIYLIFENENKYKLEGLKNYNFDDNNLNFIEYFMRYGGLEILAALRIKGDINLDNYMDRIENEINLRINNKTNNE